MTPEEQFLHTGKQALTRLAAAIYDLSIWAEAFEARGGAGVFGPDADLINNFIDDLIAFVDSDKQTTISKFRTDV